MLAHGGTVCPLELLALPALVAYAWGTARCARFVLGVSSRVHRR